MVFAFVGGLFFLGLAVWHGSYFGNEASVVAKRDARSFPPIYSDKPKTSEREENVSRNEFPAEHGEVYAPVNLSALLESYIAENPYSKSLEGVAVDGAIRFDDEGRLLKVYSLRLLFDQLLSLQGEWEIEEIDNWLHGYAWAAADGLSSPQHGVTQLMSSYFRYIDYLHVSGTATPPHSMGSVEDITSFQSFSQDLYKLKRDSLGEELADAFFSDEERYEASQLERAHIYANTELLASEKAEALQLWLDNQEPLFQAAARGIRVFDNMVEQVDLLRASGADGNQVFALREDIYGAEAAERLAALDRERQQWQDKVKAYHVELERIQSAKGISTTEMNEQIQNYMRQAFTEAQRRRIGR